MKIDWLIATVRWFLLAINGAEQLRKHQQRLGHPLEGIELDHIKVTNPKPPHP